MFHWFRDRKSRIGFRMVFLTVVFSSVATLVITAVQLFADYRQQMEDLDRRMAEVNVLLPSLAASVWTFNDRQIHLGLRALVELPDIEFAAITTSAGDGSWSEGHFRRASTVVERVYPVDYERHGGNQRLGVLQVNGSLDSIYRRLAGRAILMVGSNGIKTFLVAGFMLYLFRHLVTGRLTRLERRMEDLAPQLNLPHSAGPGIAVISGDEIDKLDGGFVALADNLAHAVSRLQQAERDLREANQDLNQRVLDRTAQLEAVNASLESARQRAEESAAAERHMRLEQRNFLGMVSHEFRLPLSIIGAAGQLLPVMGPPLTADQQDEVSKVLRAVGRLTDLMDVCLTDERLDAGEITLHTSEVRLDSVLGDLCRELNSVMPGRVSLCVTGDPAPLEADGALLRIALSNLADNALKFSPPTIPVVIHLAFSAAGVTIRVEDHGCGIAEADRERIFEKFFRSRQSDGISGAGLGLFIVKRIIDLHHGTITVDSQQGIGTTVAVFLPRRRTP